MNQTDPKPAPSRKTAFACLVIAAGFLLLAASLLATLLEGVGHHALHAAGIAALALFLLALGAHELDRATNG